MATFRGSVTGQSAGRESWRGRGRGRGFGGRDRGRGRQQHSYGWPRGDENGSARGSGGRNTGKRRHSNDDSSSASSLAAPAPDQSHSEGASGVRRSGRDGHSSAAALRDSVRGQSAGRESGRGRGRGRSFGGRDRGRGRQQHPYGWPRGDENGSARGSGGRNTGKRRHPNDDSSSSVQPRPMVVIKRTPAAPTSSSFPSAVSTSNSSPTLHWHSPHRHVPVESEQALLPTLLRWSDKERGMMRTQPSWRIYKIEAACRSTGIGLLQALSLRRHHMKLLNPFKSMAALQLGSENDVREAAALFEDAVEAYLVQSGVPFFSEEEQKHRSSGKVVATPDFLLQGTVRVSLSQGNETASSVSDHKTVAAAPASMSPVATDIHWIEAKMFFGASSVPDGTNNAVGAILPKAQKYVSLYGPGAMVFSYGCGEGLARKLAEIGVVALDAHPLDLTRMEEQQRTWCADEKGRILP